MSKDQQALFTNIKANPDDVLLRLVYADWLEERGDKLRADFIRYQCGEVGFNKPTDKEIKSIFAADVWHILKSYTVRHRKLDRSTVFAERGAAGYGGGIARVEPRQFIIRNGFIEQVRCTMRDWMAIGRFMVERNPIRKVVVSDKDPSQPYTAFHPYLWRISTVASLYGNCWVIPDCIGGPGIDARTDGFQSRADAFNWLSDRCIKWAETQASSLNSLHATTHSA